MRLKDIIILAVFCIIPRLSQAFGFAAAQEDGGRPGAFLSYGAGARALGMGGTFTGVADDASAAYWNPAGLTLLNTPEITALYASLYEQTGYSYIGYGYPISKGAIGVSVVNLNSAGFQLRDELNNETGTAGLNDTAIILTYAGKISNNVLGGVLAGGVNFKAINQNINSVSGSGCGADFGFLWKPGAAAGLPAIFAPLSAGLNLQNVVAPRVNIGDEYPLGVTLGFGYRFFDDKMLAALDINKTDWRQAKVHLGGEYILDEILAVRLGIAETEITSGFGIKWRNYALDYAFAYHNALSEDTNLGVSHRLGITIKFAGR